MTRRTFFRSALACLGAMVLAPVRVVAAPTRRKPTYDECERMCFLMNEWFRLNPPKPVVWRVYYRDSIHTPRSD